MMSLGMDIEYIRSKVLSGHYAVDDHALIEALKEGILVDDYCARFCMAKSSRIIPIAAVA
jgi:hypothetical protein